MILPGNIQGRYHEPQLECQKSSAPPLGQYAPESIPHALKKGIFF